MSAVTYKIKQILDYKYVQPAFLFKIQWRGHPGFTWERLSNIRETKQFQNYLEQLYNENEKEIYWKQLKIRDSQKEVLQKLMKLPKYLIMNICLQFDPLMYRVIQTLTAVMRKKHLKIPEELTNIHTELTIKSYFFHLELTNRKQLRDYKNEMQMHESEMEIGIENVHDFTIPQAFEYTNECILSSDFDCISFDRESGCSCRNCDKNSKCCNAKGLECGKNCKCDATCANRKFQQNSKSSLSLFKTKKKGFGVKTLKKIMKGTYLFEYTGKLITITTADKSSSEYLFDNPSDKLGLTIVDAKPYGNLSRFVNHSCDGNIVSNSIENSSSLLPRLCFEARRNIFPGTELTINYNFKSGNKKCYCGSKNCKGKMKQC